MQTITRLEHEPTGAPIWLVPGRSSQAIRNPSLRAIDQWRGVPTRQIRQVLEERNCRALLVQEYEDARFDVLVRLAGQLGIPAYATFQGGDLTLSLAERLVRRRSIKAAAGLMVSASMERERVWNRYGVPPPPVASHPNPLDCEEWRASPRDEARRALGLPEHEFVAITHGRIDIHRKGLDVLLSAWSGPGLLVLIGSGQDRTRFMEMVQGRADVRWIDGYTNDRHFLRQWLSAADLYVSASRVEGMPVAPLEAMACGLPVVATDAQGLSDIIGRNGHHGGLLVPRDDPGALAAAIERMRQDPDLRRSFGRAARSRVEHAFSIEAVGSALRDFLSP
jgi:starch synthase